VKSHGKRYRNVAEKIAAEQAVGPRDALELVKQTATAKFDETVDLAIRLGVDPRHGEQMVRGTVNLPHGTGKSPRVAAFAKGEKATQAEAAGADVVGAEDLVQRIETGWKDFDVLVATRDVMSMVGRLGKRLGPRMPNPKAGTVTDDIARAITELKSGKVEFRVDKVGNLHAAIGKASFPVEHLVENFAVFTAALLKAKPAAAKGQYLRKICVSSTMGPSVNIDPTLAQQTAEQQSL